MTKEDPIVVSTVRPIFFLLPGQRRCAQLKDVLFSPVAFTFSLPALLQHSLQSLTAIQVHISMQVCIMSTKCTERQALLRLDDTALMAAIKQDSVK